MRAPDVAHLIHTVRDQRVILDADLAGLYGLPTKRLNEQYRRNLDRSRADFAFQLTPEEWLTLRPQIAAFTTEPNLKSQIATSSSSHGGRRKLPVAFSAFQHFRLSLVSGLQSVVPLSAFPFSAFGFPNFCFSGGPWSVVS